MTVENVRWNQRMNGAAISALLADHFRRMPRWHRSVLMFALIGMVVGTVGVVRRSVAPSHATQQVASTASPRNGFINDPSASTDDRAKVIKPAPADGTPWYLSPSFLRIGGSTVGGFVIGWLMRTFVKTVSLGLAAIATLIGTASYFRWFNVDFSAAHQEFQTASSWLMNQMTLLKSSAIAHLPSHTGAALGAYIGFKRR